MAYKKFITRGGKKFGPYYYKSIKKDGRVITEYLGTFPPKKTKPLGNINKFLFFGAIFALIIFFAFFISNIGLTGKVSVSIEDSYISGENLYGNLIMNLEENEFIPASSKVLINNSGEEQEFLLKSIIVQEPAQGNFYIADKNISGFGEGYGFSGNYPGVSFVLDVFSEKSENITLELNETESKINETQNESIEINETIEEISENLTEISEEEIISNETSQNEIPIETPIETSSETPAETQSEISNKKSETKVVEKSANKEEKEKTSTKETAQQETTTGEITQETQIEELPFEETTQETQIEPPPEETPSETPAEPNLEAGITGNIIRGILGTMSKIFMAMTGNSVLELESQISGEVSKDKPFIYELKQGQTAKINFSEQEIDLNIVDAQATITTNYIGEENKNKFNINFSNLNLTAKNGELNIKLIYEDIEIASITKEIFVENETKANATANITIIETTKNYPIVVGRPVKWLKEIKIENKSENKEVLIEIPKQAQGPITIKIGKQADDELNTLLEYEKALEYQETKEKLIITKIDDNNQIDETDIQNLENEITDFIGRETFGITGQVIKNTGKVSLQIDLGEREGIAQVFWRKFKGILTGNIISELGISETQDNIIVNITEEIQSSAENETIILEYYTQAPQIFEQEIENGKRITISASDLLNYTNILAYTTLNNSFGVKSDDKIRVLWENNETGNKESISFSTNDLDKEGNIDYVEWLVPHLSNQTYDIIVITDAIHLDSNKSFISNIYNEAKELDGIWSEPINSGEYVRVTFETNLTSSNEITFYVRNNKKNTYVELYYFNSSELIATSEEINLEGFYQVFLANMIGAYDTFDLKVVNNNPNAYLEFEYIVDPIQLFLDDFESGALGNWTVTTSWAIATDQALGTYSAKCTGANDCDMKLATPVNTASASQVNVTFSFRDDDLDGAGDAPYYWNDSSGNWDLAGEINVINGDEETWLSFSNTTTDSQYFHSNFNIRFVTTLDGGGSVENLWIDNVNVLYNDSSPPTIVFVSPTNTTYSTGTLDYNATITDNAISKVLVSVDGGANMTATNDSATNFYNLSAQHSAVSGQGLHNITFFANNTDGYGNTNTTYFTLDTIAPVITLPVYTNGTIGQANGTLKLNISVTDATTTPSRCLVDVNGTNQSLSFSNGWCNTSTLGLRGLENGNFTINVWANDSANNWALNNSYVVDILNPFVSGNEASDATSNTNQRKIVRNSTQAIHIVYAGTDSKAYHRSSTNNGTTWSSENSVSTGTCSYSSLAINSTDSLYVACGNGAGNNGLYSSVNNGVTWTEINTNTNRVYASLLIDSSDNLHLIGHDPSDVYYKNSSNQGTTWSSEATITSSDGGSADDFADIVINSTGGIFVMWVGASGSPGDSDVYYNTCTSLSVNCSNGANWLGETIAVNTAGEVGASNSEGISAVIDNSNNIHIVFVDDSKASKDKEIYYSKYTGSWSSLVNISIDDSLGDASPVITTNGTALWIVWEKATTLASLYYSNSTNGGSTWTTPVAFTDTSFKDDFPTSIRNSSVAGGIDFIWIRRNLGSDTLYDIFYGNMSIGEGLGGSADSTNPTASFGTNPVDNFAQTSQSITFDLKCQDNTGVSTLQLFGNWTGTWSANQTNSSPINNTFWNVSVSNIPEGTYLWGVWCNDTTGNSDWSDTNRTFTIDFTAPNIAIDSPLNQSYNLSNTIWANVTLNENGNWCGRVLDGTSKNTTMSNDSMTHFYNNLESPAGEGLHDIIFWCNDTLGNMGNSGYQYFTTDSIAPVITLPVYTNATLKKNTEQLTLNISVSDATTTPQICLVDVNGTNQSLSFSSGWCNSSFINLTNLANGNQTIKVWANDSAENWGLNNSYVVQIDSSSPTSDFGANPINALNSSSTTQTFDLKCTDNLAISTLQLWTNTTGTWSANQTNSSTINNTFWNVTVSNIADGNYVWGVYCNDTTGNSDWSDTNRSLRIDTTPPTVAQKFINDTSVNVNEAIRLNVTATDSLAISQVFTTITYPNATIVNITMTSVGGDTFEYNLSVGATAGTFYYNTTYANDTAGNLGSNTTILSAEVLAGGNNPPNNPSPLLLSIGGSNQTTADLNCSSSITDPDSGNTLNVSIRWYKNSALNLTVDYNNSYANNTLFNATLDNGNTTKGENWTCSMRLYDGTDYSAWVNSSNITILNTLPTISLTGPAHGNTTTNRTPEFTWSGADDDSDTLSYEINLTAYYTGGGIRSACGVYKDNNTLGSATSYIPSPYLKCLSDNNYFFNWTVRAWDGEGYGSWATERNISIQSDITISLPTSSVSFGNMNVTDTDDTTDASPAPMILRNDGNAELNVSVNFTNLWNSVANPSDYLKYKIRNITNVCFILANTQTNWAQAPLSTSLAVHRLNFTSGYQTGCNNVSVDLSVEVPGDEISGNKNSNITFISSLGELGYGAD